MSIFFLVKGSELYFLSQIMSIEDVERIMDETREGIEYQRVSDINWKALISAVFNQMLTKTLIFFPQEIDELLSGSLTQEDEDAVLQELEEMTKVCTLYLLLTLFSHKGPWSWAAEWEWGYIDDTRGTKPTSFPGSLFFPSFIANKKGRREILGTRFVQSKGTFDLTFFTQTSVCIFSTLFFIHFLRCWQGEFVCQSKGSFPGDYFLYFHDLNVQFRSYIVGRN